MFGVGKGDGFSLEQLMQFVGKAFGNSNADVRAAATRVTILVRRLPSLHAPASTGLSGSGMHGVEDGASGQVNSSCTAVSRQAGLAGQEAGGGLTCYPERGMCLQVHARVGNAVKKQLPPGLNPKILEQLEASFGGPPGRAASPPVPAVAKRVSESRTTKQAPIPAHRTSGPAVGPTAGEQIGPG